MPSADKIQLLIEILGEDGLEKLALAAEKVRAKTEAAAKGYELLDTVVAKSVGPIGTYEIATDRLNQELDEEVRKAVEATRAQQALAAALETMPGATSQATAALGRLGGQKSAGGGGALGAAYGLQDVVTVLSMGGGWDRALMSATNNITPMLVGLGAGGGLAGVAGLAVTAIVAMSPALEGLGRAFDGSIKTQVPEAADKIERLTEAVKKDKDSIEELRKARELDYFQLQKYVQATADLSNKEQELADARKARSVGGGEDRKSRERGSAFREALQEYGGGEKLIGALERAGVDEQRATRMVSDALSGASGVAEDIQGRLAGLGNRDQLQYFSPRRRRQAERQREQTDARLKANAEAAKQRRQDEIERSRELNRNLAEIDRENRAEQKRDEAAGQRKLQQDIDLSRRVGQAATRRQATPVGDTHHLPLMSMEGGDEKAMAAIVANQQAMSANMAALQQVQQQAQGVMQQQRQLQARLRRGSEQSPLPSGLQR